MICRETLGQVKLNFVSENDYGKWPETFGRHCKSQNETSFLGCYFRITFFILLYVIICFV